MLVSNWFQQKLIRIICSICFVYWNLIKSGSLNKSTITMWNFLVTFSPSFLSLQLKKNSKELAETNGHDESQIHVSTLCSSYVYYVHCEIKVTTAHWRTYWAKEHLKKIRIATAPIHPNMASFPYFAIYSALVIVLLKIAM